MSVFKTTAVHSQCSADIEQKIREQARWSIRAWGEEAVRGLFAILSSLARPSMDEDGEPQKMRDNLSNQPQSLDDVISTDELENRNVRTSESERERRITSDLTHALAKSPDQFFSRLVQAIVELTNGESAGVSILDKSRGIFVWPAVEGGLASYVGSGTPSDFGPCGTVLDRNAPVLFIHPQKHFTYLQEIQPSLEEVLLMPFRMDGKRIGTIGAALHQPGSQFDAEDRRLLKTSAISPQWLTVPWSRPESWRRSSATCQSLTVTFVPLTRWEVAFCRRFY